ncbi:MAG: tetratricopeptide repeat protein, partial [Bryobacteraceae bacterium]|nr:tetratricopeptide repeat protein [Bryobacteraceae bacterium]
MGHLELRAYREQAAELIESGQPQAALRIAQQILRLFPQSLHGHCLLGRALLGLGRFDEAAEAFHWVLAADPENVEASLGLAVVYQKSGDRQRAIAQLQYAFELFPAEESLRERLNAVAETLAATQVPGVLELNRVALARIYARNGLRAKALQELQAILAQQPQRHDVRLALAEALWQEGLHQEAVAESQRVLAALPNALKANWIMAAAWLETSQPEMAQPYLARAQALDPEHEMASALFGPHSPVPPEHPALAEWEGGTDLLSHTTAPAWGDALGWDIRDLAQVSEKEAIVMSEPSPSEEPFEIPDWLKDLGDEILSEAPTAPEPIATPETAGGDAQAALPDWLQALIARAEAGGLEPVATEETGAALPLWLTEIPAEETRIPPPAETAPLAAAEALPGQRAPDQAPAELPSRDAEAELPEWLREIQPDASWARPEMAPPATEAALSQLPEWLRDETVADEVAPVQMDELPAWLRGEAEETATPPFTEPAASAAALPEWLRELEGEQPVPSAETPPSASSAAPTEAPSWLTEEETTTLPTTPVEAPPVMFPEAEAPLPEWLQELRAADRECVAAPTEQPPAEAEEEEASMPEWLRRLRAGIAEAPPPSTRELEEDLARLSIVAPAE